MSSRFVKNSMLGALAGGAIALASFLSSLAVARTLSVRETGTIAYIVWLVWMAAPFIDLGLSSAAARFVPFLRGSGQSDQAERLARKLAQRLLISVLCVGSCGIVLLYLYGDIPIAEFLSGGTSMGASMPLVVLTLLLIAGQALVTYVYAQLRGQEQFGLAARIAGVSFLLQIAGVTCGALLFGVTGALAGYALGMLLPAGVCLSKMRGPGAIEPALRRRVTIFALYCWGANITSAFVWSRIELLFLERYWGMESVAMFAVALSLTQLAIQGPTLLTSAMLSSLSERHGRDDIKGMKEEFSFAIRILGALVLPICFGMAAIVPELLPLLFGSKFAAAVPAAMILIPVAAFGVLSTIATSLVQSFERSDFVFASSLCGAICALAAGFLLIPELGLMGAVFARVAIQILMIGLGWWFVVTRLGFAIPFMSLLKLSAAALASAGAASVLMKIVPHPSGLPLAITAAVAVYVVALRVLKAIGSRDEALLRRYTLTLPPVLADVALRLTEFVTSTKQSERMVRP